MTPAEVVERFTDTELVHLQAYQELYGPIGDRRLDYLFARLGMDVVAPHLKRGKRTAIEDHLIPWGGKTKRQQTPQEMLAVAQGIQRTFDYEARRGKRPAQGGTGEQDGDPRGSLGPPWRGRGRRRA